MISNRIKAMLAGVCSVAAAAVLAVAAAPAGAFVYTDNPGGGVVQFSAGSSGALWPLSPRIGATGTQGGPEALSPDGNSLYVANAQSSGCSGWAISQYSVAADGTLSVKGPARPVCFSDVSALAVSPDDKYLYVVGGGSDGVRFQIGSGGVLPANPDGWGLNTDDDPTGVAIAPDSRYVYVTSYDDGTITENPVPSTSAYASTVSDGSGSGNPGPVAIAVNDAENSVYVVNWNEHTVEQYNIGFGGTLSPKLVPAVSISGGGSGIAVSPNGQYVYVTGQASDGAGFVNEFAVGAGGELSPISGSPLSTGTDALGAAVSPDGSTVYVSAQDYVWDYKVEAGGALSPLGTTPGPQGSGGNVGGGIVAGGPETNLTASHHPPLTLTLTAGASNAPLAGQTLTFTAAGKSCTTTTNASGQAGACESSIAALTSGFDVTYAGDSDYPPSTTQTLPLDEIVPPPV